MTNESRSALLTLPRELRDEIYLNVLRAQREPPQSVDEVLKDRPNRQIEDRRAALQYEDKPVAIASSGLLGVNRQVATEVRKLLSAYDLPCVLDVHANWRRVYPTWLALPTHPRLIQDVRVVFHVASHTNMRLPSVWSGNAGIGHITQGLLELLARFIAHGPLLEARGRNGESWKPLHLRTITIEYMPEPEEEPTYHWWEPSDAKVLEVVKRRPVTPQEDHVLMLASYLGQIAGSGVLFGKVQKLELKYIGRNCHQAERYWGFKFEHHSWGSLASWIPESQPAEKVSANTKLYSGYGWFPLADSCYVEKFT